MKKSIAIFLLICFLMGLGSCTKDETQEPVGDFTFTLVWGCYGISSYDSATGKLVKTSHATHPEDYVTNFYLTEEQMAEISALLQELDLESYPDEYDPHLTEDGQTTRSDPSMDLILTLQWDGKTKTVACRETALHYTSRVKKGNGFLQTCKTIIDMLTASEEWKSLPPYEFLYD
ncbi:MAG: hypothetical protein IJ489_05015 [Clostridia bacterium]|nr:hypothetical protein [Clostridia bacterium]